MNSYQVRGAHRYNRLVRILGSETPSIAEFDRLVKEANETIEPKVRDMPEEWDGFKKLEMDSKDLRFDGTPPRFSWYSWMRRWYIAGDKSRPHAKQVDVFFIHPDLLVFRGETSEVDRAFAALRPFICDYHAKVKLETVPFNLLWFMWLFENAPLDLGKTCTLRKITDIRLIGGEEGFEGQDIREYKSEDVTKSLFTAIALLLRRDIAGITCEMNLGPNGSNITYGVQIISGEDRGVKPSHLCEILAADKPTRGAFYLPGGLITHMAVNNMKFLEAMIIARELVDAFNNWADLPKNKQVPTDAIIDDLTEIVEDSTQDILVEGPKRLKKWLEKQRR